MPEILTRAGKGSDLTPSEADANFKATVRQVTTTAAGLSTDNRGTIEGLHASTPFTITLLAVATAAAVDTGDYYCTVANIGAAAVTVDGNASETINGSTDTLTLARYSSVTVALNTAGTGWQIIARTGDIGAVTPTTVTASGIVSVDDTTDSTSGTTGSIHTDGGAGFAKDAVTDANFKPLGDTAAGDKAAFGYTAAEGAIITGQGSTNDITLKNDADADVMTVATGGTVVDFPGSVTVADDALYPSLLQTETATTSGTSHDYTSIPSWVKKIHITFYAVSLNALDNMIVLIGDSGGIEATGYLSAANDMATSTSFVAGFIITRSDSSSNSFSGQVTISLLDASLNRWASSGILSSGVLMCVSSGTKALTGALDRVRLTSQAGSATFDSGSFNVMYE